MLRNEIEDKVNSLKIVLDTLNEEPKNFEEMIFQKYIELGGVAEVAAYVNEQGYRIPSAAGERKYISGDITQILVKEESKKCVNDKLYLITTQIQNLKRKTWEDKVLFIYDKYYKNNK